MVTRRGRNFRASGLRNPYTGAGNNQDHLRHGRGRCRGPWNAVSRDLHVVGKIARRPVPVDAGRGPMVKHTRGNEGTQSRVVLGFRGGGFRGSLGPPAPRLVLRFSASVPLFRVWRFGLFSVLFFVRFRCVGGSSRCFLWVPFSFFRALCVEFPSVYRGFPLQGIVPAPCCRAGFRLVSNVSDGRIAIFPLPRRAWCAAWLLRLVRKGWLAGLGEASAHGRLARKETPKWKTI